MSLNVRSRVPVKLAVAYVCSSTAMPPSVPNAALIATCPELSMSLKLTDFGFEAVGDAPAARPGAPADVLVSGSTRPTVVTFASPAV